MNKYFLRLLENGFSFLVDGFNEKREFLDTDIPIKEEDYLKWNYESTFKRFRLKEVPTGTELFDYIEEYIPEIDTTPQAPTTEDRLHALEEAMLMII